MNRKVWIILLSILAAALQTSSGGSWAFGQDGQALIRAIDEQQKKIQTLAADFFQKKETSLAKAPLVSSGTVKFKRPDRVHFIYSKPEQMEMALEGKTIWIYYPIRSQAEKFSFAGNKRVTQYLEPVTGIFQKTFGQLAETYHIGYRGEELGHLYCFRLQPKDDKVLQFLSRVDVWIDRASGAILRFEMIEANRDRLLLEFKDLQINPPLNDEDLALRIPPTVKVLEKISP
ncbi:MAG: outer membrane lipoprotein carrier protein LolA [Syntrophaceae bacterium]|nr:outer membrane lipoprotein carrier protein LolA [Syntrophaceae bacterium]